MSGAISPASRSRMGGSRRLCSFGVEQRKGKIKLLALGNPVGRAAQAAVCKIAQVGATPARDSNLRPRFRSQARVVAPKHEVR